MAQGQTEINGKEEYPETDLLTHGQLIFYKNIKTMREKEFCLYKILVNARYS